MDEERIDVFYGRTDSSIGDNEYSAVILYTTETRITYGSNIYEPCNCNYIILKTYSTSDLYSSFGVKLDVCDWVVSPLKESIISHWRHHELSNALVRVSTLMEVSYNSTFKELLRILEETSCL